MADADLRRGYSTRMRARRICATSLSGSPSTRFLGVLRAHLSAAAVRRRRQLVPRVAGDRAQRPDRACRTASRFKAWPQAWAHYCVAGTCEGIQRNFYNSLIMTIPATIISTLLGAINGYVLSKWRFPGSETLFACMTLGVFMPGQIALLPWAFMLGTSACPTRLRPHSRPLRPGALLHDAVLPQLLHQHPRRPDQGGAHRRRGLLAHLLQDRPAALAADPDRHRDLAVHRHLERISVRRRLHRRAPAADHRGAGRAARPVR